MPKPVPAILYKYLHPERLDVLEDSRIRFSPRSAFEDDHELQPDYKAFGTFEEIKRHIERGGNPMPWVPSASLARLIASNSWYQHRALAAAVANITSTNKLGILCLTVDRQSGRMWNEYALNSTGFVIGFDTRHEGFRQMTHPRGIGEVIYSSEGFATFLGMIEADALAPLYRKRMPYSYEQEWRSLRFLSDLEAGPTGMHFGVIDPGSIVEVGIRPGCVVETQIRNILEHERYRHVHIVNEH